MSIARWPTTVAHILLVIAIAIVLLFTPLYLFVTPGFVHQEYSGKRFPPAERFSDVERIKLSDPVLRYLRGRVTRAELAAVKTNAGDIAFRDEEVEHLADVKGVMDGMFVAHGVAIGVFLACVWLLWSTSRRSSLPLYLRQGVWVTGALILGILLASTIDFDTFFTSFHQIFFTPGTWVFYMSDTLIQLYPLPLWVDAVWKYGLFILFEAGLVYLLSMGIARRLHSQEGVA